MQPLQKRKDKTLRKVNNIQPNLNELLKRLDPIGKSNERRI